MKTSVIFKRLAMLLFVAGVMVGLSGQAYGQTGKKKGKKSTTTISKKKGTKKAADVPPVPQFVPLPYNANDCLFAIPLTIDKPYGPTTPPDGAGRVQEIVADKAHPHIFEREHNSVWYKVSIPYNGYMEIRITQVAKWDDYDFLVYRNTGTYFSNQVMMGKVSPVAINMAGVDSVAMYQAVYGKGKKGEGVHAAPKAPVEAPVRSNKKKGEEEVLPLPEVAPDMPPTLGMLFDAKDVMLTKRQTGSFIKSIPVRAGEEYYIVVDNNTVNGQGHTIKVSVHVDAYEPWLLFYDKKGHRYVDVNLMVLERGNSGTERPIIQDEHWRGGKVKFVPGFGYLLYAKRDGYFSVYKEFNSRDLMERGDTVMLYHMTRTERGSTFPIRGLNFESGESTLIGNYDSVLTDFLAMFRNHPDVTFLIKGYVQSYGVDAEADMLLSLERAKSIKQWFTKNGVEPKRISTSGMTKNEIKRAAAAALSDGGGFSDVKAEIIITGKGE